MAPDRGCWRESTTRHYCQAMSHRRSSSLRALLLLLLAAGPLQAQSVFACAMMDALIHDVCCCDDHNVVEGCVETSCGTTLEAREEPCCERSVEVTADPDSRQAAPVGKRTHVGSDADPPHALVSSIDALIAPQARLTPGVSEPPPAAASSGSDIWLTTQRLRI